MIRAISLCAIVLVALSAASGAGGAPPAASGWVTFAAPSDIGTPVRQQVQGTLSLATLDCVFSFNGSVAPGSQGVELAQVAYNPNTCQAVYLVGTPSSVAPQAGPAGAAEDNAAGGTPSRSLSSTATAAASSTSAAYLRTWYEDPATIDVTVLRNDVEWTHNGSCNSSYKWKRNASWFTPSGWYLKYVNDSPGFSCSNAVSNSNAKMQNDVFCFAAFHDPESVWTTYNYNHDVIGKPNGGYTWTYNDFINSTLSVCYRLLGHHASTGFESPW